MDRRRDGDWMIAADERILEHLYEQGGTTAALMISVHGLPNDTHLIRERLRVLSQAGYVRPDEPDSQWYEIASDGVAYLRGRRLANYLHPHPTPDWPGHLQPRRVY